MGQAPIKVNEETKERIRYLTALTDATQAKIVDRAVSEYAARRAEEIAAGMKRARAVLGSGDAAVAAHLLDEPVEAVESIAGPSAPANSRHGRTSVERWRNRRSSR